MDERLPEQSQQATLRSIGDEGLRQVVQGCMDAMQRGDVEGVVGMLADDAAWSMRPLADESKILASFADFGLPDRLD